MPTGYTADIAKGISFKEYAFQCARAFGALIMMRDSPSDAPIPEKFEPSTHYDKTINETTTKLDWLKSLSAEELKVATENDYQQQLADYKKRVKENDELREKYEAMLEQAKAYVAPTPDHEDYARFLVSQIEESIKFDCSTGYFKEPDKYKPAAWLGIQVKTLLKTLDYYTEEKQKEIDRVNKRNEWIAQLRQSLK